jgi:tryptophan synthase alpha chain
MSLRQTLLNARAKGASAFIPFIMAGDPGAEESARVMRALEEAGADALELGVPFSDPVADGPVVARAHARALGGGMTLSLALETLKRARGAGLKMPVCLFSYLNPVMKMGFTTFARAAREAGAQGALIVDLPPEEAGAYLAAMRTEKMETVFLSSPTTSPERLKLIDAASSGFVYHVARAGVTGAREDLAPALREKLAELKVALSSPVAAGFGISSAAHVRALEGAADAVVVGSALVARIAENPDNAARAAGAMARELKGN